MPRLRVLYDATLADNPAGTGTFVRGLLGALQARSDLEVLVHGLEVASVRTLDTRQKSSASRLQNSLRHLAYYLAGLPAAAKRADADVIFSPSSLVPLRGSTPLVMTVFDLTVRRWPDTVDPISRVYALRMLAAGLRRSRAICTISRAVADELRGLHQRAQPIVVAYPGPNPDLTAAVPEPAPIGEQPFLLMVGTMEPRKNHLTVVQAFAAYLAEHPESNLALILAGSAGWRYEAVLRSIDQLRIAPRIRRLGSVGTGQLKWLYQHARALLFPSIYEGFGLPVLEAFSFGCPVIAASIPPVREIAGRDTAILLHPTAVAEWTNAIERAGSAPPDQRRIDAALTRARDFTWERCAEGATEAMIAAAGGR